MSTNQTTAGEAMYRTNRRKLLGYLGAAPRIGRALGGDVKRAAIGVHLAMFAMAVFGGVETAFADSIYSFTTIDVPGALSTSVFGINDSGQIVGDFWDGLNGHGFLLDTSGSITTIDVPGAWATRASGINDNGQIVGTFYDATGTHGFLLDTSGSITTI